MAPLDPTTVSCSSTIRAAGVEAPVTVMSAPEVFLMTPNPPVMPEAAALTHGWLTASAAAAVAGAAEADADGAAVEAEEAQPVRARAAAATTERAGIMSFLDMVVLLNRGRRPRGAGLESLIRWGIVCCV